jgi:hypothetical protein
MLAGNSPYIPSSFYNIATVNGTGSAGNITFSSIPQTYKSLQLRVICADTSAGTVAGSVSIRVNGVSTSTYSLHEIEGDGSAVNVGGFATYPAINYMYSPYSGNTNIYAVGIFDFIDYASTTKNKTSRGFFGFDKNGAGGVKLQSGSYPSTTAITSLTLVYAASAFTTSSSFALYGIN